MTRNEEQRLGRAPWISAGPLDHDQQVLVTRIASSWSGAVGVAPIDPEGRLTGPFDLLVASPTVGTGMLDATESFQHSSLSIAERELVILVVAAVEEAPFMWAGHQPVALRAGISRDAADAMAVGTTPDVDGGLALIHRVARQLVATGDLDDETWNDAERELGWRRVNEIVWLVGVYRAFALAMRVARTPLPETVAELTDD